MSTEVHRTAAGDVNFEQHGVVHTVRVYTSGLRDAWIFEVEGQGKVALGVVSQEDAVALAEVLLAGPVQYPEKAPEGRRKVRVRDDATSGASALFRGQEGTLMDSTHTEVLVRFREGGLVALPANAIVEI